MVGGAAPHESPQVTQEGHLGRAGERGKTWAGRGGRRNNGRTAWQRIVGYLASRGTGAPPHVTLGCGLVQQAPYVRGEGGCRFMPAWVKEVKKKRRPNTGRGRENRKRRTRLRLHLG